MKALLVAFLLLALTAPAFGQAVGNGSSAGAALPVNSSGTTTLTAPHFEVGQVTNASVSCLLLALCTIANVTFKSNYTGTPFCVVTPVAATAPVSWTPTISAVGTTGFTANLIAAIALVSSAIAGMYVCVGQ